jgi:hypothetical protein
VRWLRDGATVVDDPTQQPPVHSKDPGDHYLIALAASQRAALVSGDHHLLALSAGIPVYSPRDFLDTRAEPEDAKRVIWSIGQVRREGRRMRGGPPRQITPAAGPTRRPA